MRREAPEGVCCVFQLSEDILNVHKMKRKLSLRDATESVYIGGLCNRLLLVFGTLVFRDRGRVNIYFRFRVTKKKNICTLYFDCFLYQRHMQRNGDQPVKVRFCTAYLTPY